MNNLRITMAQINPTIGDIDFNINLMRDAAMIAHRSESNMVVFPELSLTAYSPGDMLDDPGFIDRIDAGLKELIQATLGTPGLYWVIGSPTRRAGPGKKLENSLLVLRNGEIVLKYGKQLLPTYNVFDERRHFEPGPDVAKVLRVGDAHVGFLICEDGWNTDGADYAVNPFARLGDAAPDLVVSINASPSNIGKRHQRHAIFAEASRKHNFPIIYVNQIGGHDQLVFDGASFAVTPDDGCVFECARFESDIRTLELRGKQFVADDQTRLTTVPDVGLPVSEFYRRQIVLNIRDYARRTGFSTAVIGCSGGIDSAAVVALAAEALGADKVMAITMPSRLSSAGSVSDSEVLCRNLGVKLITHPIKTIVSEFEAGFSEAFGTPVDGVALENLQARARAVILMEYSNKFGNLLLTTGNKSEISVGYCTLYGDVCGGLGPIGDLYKTEVFDLCRHINEAAGRELIPNAIIEKEPSAELAEGQKDRDSLPPYPVLDTILKVLIEGERLGSNEKQDVEAAFAQITSEPEGRALVTKIKGMIARNEYKRRQSPPIVRVRGRAFGNGRQMPIAAKYDY